MSKTAAELYESLIEMSEDDITLTIGLPTETEDFIVIGTIDALDLIAALKESVTS